jgi:ferredoxin
LEGQGFDSTFVASNDYFNFYRLQPDFSHKHSAVAAGLGKLGRSSNFMHPKFGTAVVLCSVITEAELEPDPMIADDFDPCADCSICIDICPTDAISRKKMQSFVMEEREFTHHLVNKAVCIWGCSGYTGHHYTMNGRTVGTWAYNDLPVPIKEIKAAEERGDTGYAGIIDSFRNTRYRRPRHPMEIAEILLTHDHAGVKGTEYCGSCQKICVGTMENRRALLELHLNSGVVQIPKDPTMLNYLKDYNGSLQPYPIPGEET